MCRYSTTGPPPGGGGSGGGGGGRPPRGQLGSQQPQVPVAQAQDVKAMGNLPSIFEGNHA